MMGEESPRDTEQSTVMLNRVRQPTTLPEIDPSTGRPPGAAEPKIHGTTYPSLPSPRNSTHSLLVTSLSETHRTPPPPVDREIPSTISPLRASLDLHEGQLVRPSRLRWEVLQYLAHKTAAWVLVGILVMLFGIALTDTVVLPKIHTCPPSATCPRSYDPNTTNVLQLLQAFMSYWLKAGVMISSIGILKLSSYQAWFILMHQGNTFKNIDLTLGAIRGSLNDACLLLFRKNNRLLSVFVFTLLGIGTAISLVTGLSIGKEATTLALAFSYNATVDMPDSNPIRGHLNNAGQLEATSKVISWALERSRNHDGALRGSLVTPDSRSEVASNAVPGGPMITGWFECRGWGNYTVEDPPGRGLVNYIIWINETQYIAHPEMAVYVASTIVDTAVTQYLWVSNTVGLIPNATATSDGKMNIALCTHWVAMEPEEPGREGVDYLMSSRPRTTGCNTNDPDVCVADSVSKAILSWWGGIGGGFWRIRCRGGVLGPVPSGNDTETFCAPTQELWKETAVSMLDGIMQTASRSGESAQDLHSVVEGISKRRWWANATIPAATMAVYLVMLVHTWLLSRGDNVLKELNLYEIVKAAQTDHIRGLVLMDELKTAPIRYRSNFGFVEGRQRSL